MLRRMFSVVSVMLFVMIAGYGVFMTQPVDASQNKTKNDQGRKLFMTHCAACHGEDGKGNGPAAPALKVAPANLTAIAKVDGKFPALKVRRIISGDDFITGHGSREMPIWGEYFQAQRGRSVATGNVYALTKYIESIQAK